MRKCSALRIFGDIIVEIISRVLMRKAE